MTIDSYKTLYTSSVTFGIKKQLKAEQGIPALEEQVQGLEAEKAKFELELQVQIAYYFSCFETRITLFVCRNSAANSI